MRRKLCQQLEEYLSTIFSELVDLGLEFYSIDYFECIEGNTKLDESIFVKYPR